MGRTRITIDNDIFELVSTRDMSREQRSRVSRYNDADLKYMQPYKFDSLRSMRRRIRLLRLQGGGLSNPEITCELFEVEYDKDNQNIVRKVPRNSDGVSKPSTLPRSQYESIQPPANGNRTGADGSDYKDSVEYEALSWCWGTQNKDCAIRIKKGDDYYRFAVTKELSLALKYLRRPTGDRILWIDAMCIDQSNHEERNHQVQMMSRIYTGAKQACIWLGEDNDDSTNAINFIREIMRLENFDSISEKAENASRWQSLLLLMQRPWFSRRWVVQEIALARSATIYCGNDQIPWENFAVAVELFVEVETATHRLSEVMRKDETFGHVPQWFEHVSELGASVLVQATGKVFRRDGTHRATSTEETEPNKHRRHGGRKAKAVKKASRPPVAVSSPKPWEWSPQRPLLSLEYLVSSLTVFEASQPRDAVYSLLAIARDSAPLAELQTVSDDGTEEALIMSTVSSFLERKPFRVDYSRPYSDVCKDFISFCIERSRRSDPSRALDILCRPWAPDAYEAPGNVDHKKPVAYKFSSHREALWTVNPNREKNEDYWKKFQEAWKKDPSYEQFERLVQPYLPRKPKPPKNREGGNETHGDTSDDSDTSEDEQKDLDQDIKLPSWVSRISGASFALYRLPGMKQGVRIGRQNADPLVGSPHEGHRNYSAAQNMRVDYRSDHRLRFRKRPGPRESPGSGHCSLYTEGFILTNVDIVAEPARLGGIPKTWTHIAGWDDAVDGETNPPAEFWRTLVADRGKDNRNPPYYYATACKESVRKGGLRGGSVDTGALISSERNSIIAEFCRRVQAVIWNRRLIRTGGSGGVLGLAGEHVQKGDSVCIIPGCTVPVILRRHPKEAGDLEKEQMQDAIESMKSALSTLEEARFRKKRYGKKLEREGQENPALEKIWKIEVEEELKEVNLQIQDWKDQKERESEEKKKRDDQQRLRRNDAVRRVANAQRKRKGAEEAGKRRLKLRATTMPAQRSTSMAAGPGGTHYVSGSGAGPVNSADDTEKVSEEGSSGGPSQPSQQTRPMGDDQEQDGSQTTRDKSKDEQEKDDKEKERQKRKDEARAEDPNIWYEFVGEAYIHGMMDGEAVRLQINEGIPMRMFEIR